MPRIQPVLLSGGAGTRLWPLSRAALPKQFLTLAGEHSLLQATALRVSGAETFAPPIVVANAEHRFLVAEQLRAAGIDPGAILLEPEGRNSAPAMLCGALHAAELDADAIVLVLAADHDMTRSHAFLDAVQAALPAAMADRIATFGIRPDRPETAYGYILAGAPLPGLAAVSRVERFVEKPDRAAAEAYLADGRYLWNSGNFLTSAATLVAEVSRFAPEVARACQRALGSAQRDLDFLRLDPEAFAAAPSISIDYAVMEHTDRAAVVPCDPGWSDIGSFDALADMLGRDDVGNASRGTVIARKTTDTTTISTGPLIATLGVTDSVIVATPDAVLVADSSRVQEVRDLVADLRAEGRMEADGHADVHRPWGSYRTLDQGPGFLLKQIRIKPGGRLSLQKHAHRAEHWVVITGTARVTLGPDRDSLDTVDLAEHQSIDIPRGWVHRLENTTDSPVALIEVQSGDHLSEDDIFRLDDIYGR
jgi:mannose-1-phosphate guanylyltransferase/mannose-1-phosphate guanylyltransferase/mannose-6-phosphate isomerase